MSFTRILLSLLAGAGAILSLAFFLRLRFQLRSHPTHRPHEDGWQRGWPALLGLVASLLAAGLGTGGALAWRPSGDASPRIPWADLVEIGTQPLPEMEFGEGAPAADAGAAGPGVAGGDEPAGTALDLQTAAEAETTPEEPDPVSPDSEASGDDRSPLEVGALSGTRFGVRVGVFRSQENVDQLLERLRASGFDPLVSPGTSGDGGPIYFVYAGAFETLEEATAAADSVQSLDVDVLVVRMTRPSPR